MHALKTSTPRSSRDGEIHSSQVQEAGLDPASVAFARASVVHGRVGIGLIERPRDLTETPR
jgi:hypothetical protein